MSEDAWEVDPSMVHFFRETCLDIVAEPKLFCAFRRLWAIRSAIDNVSLVEGYNCWRFLTTVQSNWLAKHQVLFHKLDSLGGPAIVFEIDGYSPTVLRYIMRVADLGSHFGSLDGMRIAEIGAGYGGLAAIINSVYKPASYTIYDTPEPSGLAKLFLEQAGITTCTFGPGKEGRAPTYDLCISDYALNELGESTKQMYAAQILRNSTRGALIWADPPGKPPEMSAGPGLSKRWLEDALLRKQEIVQGWTQPFFQQLNSALNLAWGSYHFYWGM